MYALSAEAFDGPWHADERWARGSSSGAEDVDSLLRGSEDSGELGAAPGVCVDMRSGTITDPRASAFDRRQGADKDIAFGGGNPYCIGATLARLEVRLAIDTLLDRSPSWGSLDRPSERGRPRSWR
ncbi:hypothetical protein WMF11_37205 [Sorangium sp. So ce295]|uniref:hypothetical protein n=1 Tax=Sorangium sp. So ce295 TaxID=3133295 RepID=UPI003F6096DA